MRINNITKASENSYLNSIINEASILKRDKDKALKIHNTLFYCISKDVSDLKQTYKENNKENHNTLLYLLKEGLRGLIANNRDCKLTPKQWASFNYALKQLKKQNLSIADTKEVDNKLKDSGFYKETPDCKRYHKKDSQLIIL